MPSATLTQNQQRTIAIIRGIVESVCNRKQSRLTKVANAANKKQIGRQVYALQHIRERWLWTGRLERVVSRED
jgi:hypothetical protein